VDDEGVEVEPDDDPDQVLADRRSNVAVRLLEAKTSANRTGKVSALG